MSMRIDARLFNYIPAAIKQALFMLPPTRRIANHVMNDLGLPPDMLKFINYPTRKDQVSVKPKPPLKERVFQFPVSMIMRGVCGTTGNATWIRTCLLIAA